MRVQIALAIVTVALLPTTARAQSGDPGSGRELFQSNCAMCHGDDASGMMGMHPSLRGAVERLSLEGVRVTIRRGRDTMPPMPSFEGRLSEKEIDDLVAYLDTLPVGPRNFGGDGDMMDMDGMMGGGVGWLVGAVLLLVIVASLVMALVLVARKPWSRGASGGSALDILKERYARGEIDRDEYEERRRALQAE